MAVLVVDPPLASASITGDARVGSPLIGGPLAVNGATVTYKWYLNGALISGATGSSYTPLPEDLNKSISLLTTVTQPGYSVAISSSSSKVVQGGTIAKPQVSIVGTTSTGKQLSANTQVPSLTKASYQWLRNGKTISGATKQSYVLTSSDYKTLISVRVSFSRLGYVSTSSTSSSKRVGAGELVKTPEPVLTGTAKVNGTLGVETGSWDSGVQFVYQWVRDGVNIPRATSKTYKLTSADRRKEIVLRLTAKKAGYDSVVIDSRTVVVKELVAFSTLDDIAIWIIAIGITPVVIFTNFTLNSTAGTTCGKSCFIDTQNLKDWFDWVIFTKGWL
jgi:hypothetical protein